jgi:hypothetical protein
MLGLISLMIIVANFIKTLLVKTIRSFKYLLGGENGHGNDPVH